jgi:hypothetical protein
MASGTGLLSPIPALRAPPSAASDSALQARFAGTAWLRCDSWYRDDHGRIVTNWPGYMRQYAAATARIDPAEFMFVPRPSVSQASVRTSVPS